MYINPWLVFSFAFVIGVNVGFLGAAWWLSAMHEELNHQVREFESDGNVIRINQYWDGK